LEQLKPLLEDPEIKKVGQNIKYEWIVLNRYGILLQGIHFDTMIASYLLNPTKHNHNLSEIAQEYLDRKMTDYKEVVGTGGKAVTFDQVPFEAARDYSCADADVTFQLSELLLPKLMEEGLKELFDEVELPLAVVLAKMERNGVKIDADLLQRYSREVEAQLEQRMGRIYELAGETFNINSSQQLGKVLFEKLKLPVLKKTKTGYSTDVDVLTKLSLEHDLPLEVLAYRNLSKLKSTYIDALPSSSTRRPDGSTPPITRRLRPRAASPQATPISRTSRCARRRGVGFARLSFRSRETRLFPGTIRRSN